MSCGTSLGCLNTTLVILRAVEYGCLVERPNKLAERTKLLTGHLMTSSNGITVGFSDRLVGHVVIVVMMDGETTDSRPALVETSRAKMTLYK